MARPQIKLSSMEQMALSSRGTSISFVGSSSFWFRRTVYDEDVMLISAYKTSEGPRVSNFHDVMSASYFFTSLLYLMANCFVAAVHWQDIINNIIMDSKWTISAKGSKRRNIL
jgi:hypothetical protein